MNNHHQSPLSWGSPELTIYLEKTASTPFRFAEISEPVASSCLHGRDTRRSATLTPTWQWCGIGRWSSTKIACGMSQGCWLNHQELKPATPYSMGNAKLIANEFTIQICRNGHLSQVHLNKSTGHQKYNRWKGLSCSRLHVSSLSCVWLHDEFQVKCCACSDSIASFAVKQVVWLGIPIQQGAQINPHVPCSKSTSRKTLTSFQSVSFTLEVLLTVET